MRKLIAFFSGLPIICQLLFAQEAMELIPGPNLVPNPGFEEIRDELPEYDLSGAKAFRKSLSAWTSPTKTTPDLLMVVNDYEYETPRNGQAMAGILTHNPLSTRSDTWREYLQVKLSQRLITGDLYRLTFYVRQHRKSTLCSNNIGAFMSPLPFRNRDYYPLTGTIPFFNHQEVIQGPDTGWVKMTATFTATGDEQFLIIGNFFDNESTSFQERDLAVPDAYKNAYYLVDDVELCQLKRPSLANLKPEVGQVVRLDRIYFAFDKWDLLPASFEQLDQLVELMQKYPSMEIAIQGHTDSRGSDQYNFQLSDRRTRSVYDYLVQQAIEPERMTSEGFGEGKPIDTNTTDEGRQMNRRVEFVVLKIEADIEIQNVAAGER